MAVDLLIHIGWMAVAAFAVDRTYTVAMALARPVAALLEQKAGLATLPEKEEEPVPEDVTAWAMSFGSEWARDDAIRLVRERHGEFGDWNRVRMSVGLAAT